MDWLIRRTGTLLAVAIAATMLAPAAAPARSTLTVKVTGLAMGFPVQVATRDRKIACPPRCRASFSGSVTEANVFLLNNVDPLYPKQGQLPGPPYDLVPGSSCGPPHEPPEPGSVCNLPKHTGQVKMTVNLRYRPFIAFAASGTTSGTNGVGDFPQMQGHHPGDSSFTCNFDPRGPDPCAWHAADRAIATITTGSSFAAGYELKSWGGCPGGTIPPPDQNMNAVCSFTPQFDTCYPLVYRNVFQGKPGYENVSTVPVDHGCGKPGNAPARPPTDAQLANIAKITATDYAQFIRRYGIRYLTGLMVLPLRNLTYWPFDIPQAGDLSDKLIELAAARTSRAAAAGGVVIAQASQHLDGSNAVASLTERLTPAGSALVRRGLPRGARLQVVATFKPVSGATQNATVPVATR
jgi:hypothetical protein